MKSNDKDSSRHHACQGDPGLSPRRDDRPGGKESQVGLEPAGRPHQDDGPAGPAGAADDAMRLPGLDEQGSQGQE